MIWSPVDQDRSKNGGARRDRTDDLKLAKLALSQLSYGPVVSVWSARLRRGTFGSALEARAKKVVGLGRLELPTSRLSSARSNQLSYRPESTTLHAFITTKGIRRRRSIGERLTSWCRLGLVRIQEANKSMTKLLWDLFISILERR